MTVSIESLQGIVQALLAAPVYSLDLETTSAEPLEARIIGVALSTGINTWWIPFTEDDAPWMVTVLRESLRPVFDDPDKTCCMHNSKYDLSCLRLAGVELKNRIADTMIGYWMLETTRAGTPKLGLKAAVKEVFNYEMTKYAETALAMPLFGRETEDYAKDDALWTWRLWTDHVEPELKKKDPTGALLKAFWELEMPQVPVIMEMELTGISVDREYLKAQSKKIAAEVQTCDAEIAKLAGHPILVTSADQIRQLLFTDLKLAPGKKTGKSGKPSVDYETLIAYKGKHPVIDKILEHRDKHKLISTYIKPLLEFSDKYGDWRVHVSFWQCGTDLGRWSCGGGVNLQNQPRKGGIKEAFVAEKGKRLIVADFSQLELRMAAHVSGDPDLVRAYRTGADVHQQTATACGCDRYTGKTMNFGNLYGASPNKLMQVLWLDGGIKIELEQAREWQDKFWGKYKGLRGYHDRNKRRIKNGEMIFKTITGRIRNVSTVKAKGNIDESDRDRADASARFRVGTHFEISGSSADVMAISVRNVHREVVKRRLTDPKWLDVKSLVQVHDELVMEAPEELAPEVEKLVKEKMETCVHLSVPLIADVKTGTSWANAKGK